MPTHIEVTAALDHVEEQTRASVYDAIEELIWNAIDADASEVAVKFVRTPLGALTRLEAVDNGTGMTPDVAKHGFGHLGGSRKRDSAATPAGRPYHGQYGRGRFKAFAVGNRVTWTSVAELSGNGAITRFEIQGDAKDLSHFVMSDPVEETDADVGTGVCVTIDDVQERAGPLLNSEARLEVVARLAPVLLAYGVNLIWDGEVVDAEAPIAERQTESLPVDAQDRRFAVEATLFVWNEGRFHDLFVCDRRGRVLTRRQFPDLGPDFPYTITAASAEFESMRSDGVLDLDRLNPSFAASLDAIEEFAARHHETWITRHAVDAVRELQQEGTYPYEGLPESPVEHAERAVFNLCAFHVSRRMLQFSGPKGKANRRLTLRLLKHAVQSRPETLLPILDEVLNLSDEQQAELARLLEKTALSNIIEASAVVAERVQFLVGLEALLFEKQSQHVRERSQLHRLLVHELWVFGEEYTLGTDDQSLANVLRKHLSILGRVEPAAETPAHHLSLSRIPDLMLWRQRPLGDEDRVEHLVIELKAPKGNLGIAEIEQITDYGMTVQADTRFDKDKTKWVFILLGTSMNDKVRARVNQADRPRGLLYDSEEGNLRIWVREWSDVIHTAKARMRFFRERLGYQVQSSSEGLDYLREKYSDLLGAILSDAQVGSPD